MSYLVRQLTLEPVGLPFRPDALTPWLSPGAVAAHYRQYARYCQKAKELAFDLGWDGSGRLEDLVRWAAQRGSAPYAEDPLFNQAAQAWNHAFLWLCFDARRLGPQEGRAEDLRERFSRELAEAAASSFGSGWVWLVQRGSRDRVDVEVTSNAWTPIVDPDAVPLLVIDVWEHAYFTDYSFDRARYAREIVRLLDWEFAAARSLGLDA